MRLVRYTYPSYRNLTPALGSFARSPWSGLESEIDRLFETALTDFGGFNTANRFPVDLYEDKENTFVRAELPGVNRDDISVEMVDGYRHAWTEVDRFGRRRLRHGRTANHPADPRCPECLVSGADS